MPTVMRIDLYDHQIKALRSLRTGSVLCGGVGSGKSRTALAYFIESECDGYLPVNKSGEIKIKKKKDLYIITTAKKRDSLEWLKECSLFCLSDKEEYSLNGIRVVIDSWNNIGKYSEIRDAFFIFDEQRLVGSGAWVKAFLKISKKNNWILLSATPGDTWIDYIPVFIANGYYKNRSEFYRRHVVFNRFVKYPKIDRYINVGYLEKIRDEVIVAMPYEHTASRMDIPILVSYNEILYKEVLKNRWNVYEDRPIQQAGELCYVLRHIVNSDSSRIDTMVDIVKQSSPKLIVFYNFNYELDLMIDACKENGIVYAQWNGHAHEALPSGDRWIYLVQYTAGCEGWNCIDTDSILFYSQNYSYKTMEQAAGRIDRLNTPFSILKYYHLESSSSIDISIKQALKRKGKFNEKIFENEILEK